MALKKFFVASSLAALAFVSARDASATPTVNCVDAGAGRSKVVYVTGSTALRPFFGVMAPLLAKDSPAYTIVYQGAGSCAGVASIMDPAPSKRQLKDVSTNYAVFFKSDGSTQECWLDNNGGNGPAVGSDYPVADIGASDVYAASCNYSPIVGEEVKDYQGPIQPMTFVVPAASTQRSISAEAAYIAFGTGGTAGTTTAAPWLDPKFFFVRNSGSGTQQMIARAINVGATQWWGADRGGSTQVATGLKVIVDQPTAEKSIGILSADVADAERANLRILAFKGYGQTCGYYPDSNVNSKSKKNVRDGHYPIWGPAHLYAQIKGTGPSEAAAAIVGKFATPRLEQSLLDAVISRGLVPNCAMKVSRGAEMGQLASFAPTFDCGCYFDQKTDGTNTCKTCTGAGECTPDRPACNFGYCEKQ